MDQHHSSGPHLMYCIAAFIQFFTLVYVHSYCTSSSCDFFSLYTYLALPYVRCRSTQIRQQVVECQIDPFFWGANKLIFRAWRHSIKALKAQTHIGKGLRSLSLKRVPTLFNKSKLPVRTEDMCLISITFKKSVSSLSLNSESGMYNPLGPPYNSSLRRRRKHQGEKLLTVH